MIDHVINEDVLLASELEKESKWKLPYRPYTEEEWRPVVGYEDRYEVSEFGKIRNIRRPRKPLLKQWTKKPYGHKTVNIIGNNNVRRGRLVHVLVLEAFFGPKQDGQETRHLDGDSSNNHISNLKWGTHIENMADSIRHGTFFFAGNIGEENMHSKLMEKDVIEIKRMLNNGKRGKDIAVKYGVTAAAIHLIKKGKNWAYLNK